MERDVRLGPFLCVPAELEFPLGLPERLRHLYYVAVRGSQIFELRPRHLAHGQLRSECLEFGPDQIDLLQLFMRGQADARSAIRLDADQTFGREMSDSLAHRGT